MIALFKSKTIFLADSKWKNASNSSINNKEILLNEIRHVKNKNNAIVPVEAIEVNGVGFRLGYSTTNSCMPLALIKLSLLFIDEFDAFFHFESAKNIVLLLNKAINFQTILTSHNTYLMQNQLTRPDCCFIMTENKISSLFNATDKELREAHNLEKMYINGAFNE